MKADVGVVCGLETRKGVSTNIYDFLIGEKLIEAKTIPRLNGVRISLVEYLPVSLQGFVYSRVWIVKLLETLNPDLVQSMPEKLNDVEAVDDDLRIGEELSRAV